MVGNGDWCSNYQNWINWLGSTFTSNRPDWIRICSYISFGLCSLNLNILEKDLNIISDSNFQEASLKSSGDSFPFSIFVLMVSFWCFICNERIWNHFYLFWIRVGARKVAPKLTNDFITINCYSCLMNLGIYSSHYYLNFT